MRKAVCPVENEAFSPVFGLKSLVFTLKSPDFALLSRDFALFSPDFGLLSRDFKPKSRVFDTNNWTILFNVVYFGMNQLGETAAFIAFR